MNTFRRSGGPGSFRLRTVPAGLLLAGSMTLSAQVSAQATGPAVPLADVVVTATGYEQQLSDAPASITVVTREQLEGKRYRDITDALQDIPGISIEGGSGGKIESTQIYMRGLGEEYIMFLVDGKPMGSSTQAYYNGFGSATQIGWMPPVAAIERIEVIRGPMSSLYGSSALGGVINVITKKVADRWMGSLTVDGVIHEKSEAGSERQGRFYLSGPLVADRLGLSLQGSIFRRTEDDFVNGFAAKERRDLGGKLAWKLSDSQSLGFEASVGKHDNERTERTGAAGSLETERTAYGLTHEVDWGKRIRTNSFVTHETVEITNGSNLSDYEVTFVNSKTVIPLARHMITVGGEYKDERTRHDADRFPGARKTDLTRWQAALFVEDEYFFTDRLSLVGGLRYDRNEHYGAELIPRLYGVYRLSPELVVKGGVSGGYLAPTLKQADDNIVEIAARGAAWDMGNPDLKPEKSTNFEIGLNWNTAAGINAGLTVYRTDYRNKIGRETICTSPTTEPACHYNGEVRARINQYVNLDSADLQGLEASFSMPVGPLRLSSSYTYTDSEITSGASAGQPLNNLPRHILNLGADWQASSGLKLWGKARYKSSSIDAGTARIPAYTLVDFGAVYQIHKQLQVFGGIYNLLDKEVDTADYGKTLDGRRAYVGMTVSF